MSIILFIFGGKPLVEERIKDATKILNLLRSMSDYKPHFEIIGNYRGRPRKGIEEIIKIAFP